MDDNIVSLRETLFETLRALSDKSNPMEIERAYAISGIAQVIINSAKVEVDHQRLNGGRDTGFISSATKPIQSKDGIHKTQNGEIVVKNGITTHKLR